MMKRIRRERKGKKEKIVSFKYEHLPDFCYSCGIIGHIEKACPTKTRREGARQFGPWLHATILRGSSSEERSRSSSERGEFWVTNSAGSKGSKQGSDGPSWRKNESIGRDGERTTRGEEKEVMSPLKAIQNVQSGSLEGKKLFSDDKTHFVDEPNKGLEDGLCTNSASGVVSQRMQKEIIDIDFNLAPKENAAVGKNKSQPKEGVQNKYENNEVKRAVNSTFKRIERAKNKQLQKQGVETEPKKRNADLMDIDLESKMLKKIRRDPVCEAGGGEKEENTNSEFVNAGLQGQPGEAK